MKRTFLVAAMLGAGASLALAGIAAAEELPTAFDLACQGKNKFFVGDRLSSTIDYEDLISMDLSKKLFTSGDYPDPRPIVEIAPTYIILLRDGYERQGGGELIMIDRNTGTYSAQIGLGPQGHQEIAASCKVQPFSGFEHRKF